MAHSSAFDIDMADLGSTNLHLRQVECCESVAALFVDCEAAGALIEEIFIRVNDSCKRDALALSRGASLPIWLTESHGRMLLGALLGEAGCGLPPFSL